MNAYSNLPLGPALTMEALLAAKAKLDALGPPPPADITVAPDLLGRFHHITEPFDGAPNPLGRPLAGTEIHVDVRLVPGTWHPGKPFRAPEPTIREEGPGSEYFARTRKILTTYRCPACSFRAGVETEHAPPCPLPPELRTATDWKLEAEMRPRRERNEQIKVRARRTYDAHLCEPRER